MEHKTSPYFSWETNKFFSYLVAHLEPHLNFQNLAHSLDAQMHMSAI